jgi:hypothetical protein
MAKHKPERETRCLITHGPSGSPAAHGLSAVLCSDCVGVCLAILLHLGSRRRARPGNALGERRATRRASTAGTARPAIVSASHLTSGLSLPPSGGQFGPKRPVSVRSARKKAGKSRPLTGADRRDNGVIRPSSLPAICPARLPARRPCVTTERDRLPEELVEVDLTQASTGARRRRRPFERSFMDTFGGRYPHGPAWNARPASVGPACEGAFVVVPPGRFTTRKAGRSMSSNSFPLAHAAPQAPDPLRGEHRSRAPPLHGPVSSPRLVKPVGSPWPCPPFPAACPCRVTGPAPESTPSR